MACYAAHTQTKNCSTLKSKPVFLWNHLQSHIFIWAHIFTVTPSGSAWCYFFPFLFLFPSIFSIIFFIFYLRHPYIDIHNPHDIIILYSPHSVIFAYISIIFFFFFSVITANFRSVMSQIPCICMFNIQKDSKQQNLFAFWKS